MQMQRNVIELMDQQEVVLIPIEKEKPFYL
jgi:hypothetical protein